MRHPEAVPSAYFLAARAVVNEVDPVGLIGMGCPDDEYDPEVEDLVASRRPVTPEGVAEVFIQWFGADSGRITSDDAARIAEGINVARTTHSAQ